MYNKKIPVDINCGFRIALEVMGGKWKPYIIYELLDGPRRPSELKRALPSDYTPTPEDLATLQYWQDRFKAQLQKPEPEAPIDPDTGRHKTYFRFDAFIRTCLLREMEAK